MRAMSDGEKGRQAQTEETEEEAGKSESGDSKRFSARRRPVKKRSPEVICIRLVRSLIGTSPHQRAVVSGLGLRRLNQIVERKNTREIQGMVAKVPHLVQIIS